VVSLPLNGNLKKLGDTKRIAVARLNQLTKRLNDQPKMKKMYCDFIEEYLDLGHMRKIEGDEEIIHGISYMPHHGVYKKSNSTTKLRVVFNASQPSSSGVSFNDVQMNGGIVQRSLISIIMRQRMYRYALTADVTKMYRQIKMKEFCSLQRILWRKSFDDPIQELECTTVTYGTRSAPYLATRTLKKIAMDGQSEYPEATWKIINDVYVDDLITGSNDLNEALDTQNQIINLLDGAKMKLHKWCANEKR
jgi:hypothetical protein